MNRNHYFASLLLILLMVAPTPNVSFQTGASNSPPPGYTTYNLDPTLSNVTMNGLVFDPNFIPGFTIGLPNTSIFFSTGQGFAKIGYSVGPWNETYYQVPHLAVGPQNSNFQEISRTQQFRMPHWGDYYAVKAGFLSPGVNIANFNASFELSQPIYVGLRTDWNWITQISLNWSQPKLLDSSNEWAAIGIVTTEYVPSAPTKLIYTVIDFWMDHNSSTFGTSNSSSELASFGLVRSSSTSVTYHPMQLGIRGNVTLDLNLTKYTDETLKLLGYANETQAPVLSYTFLSVEGYNFQWNGTLYSFFDVSNSGVSKSGGYSTSELIAFGALISALVIIPTIYVARNKRKSSD